MKKSILALTLFAALCLSACGGSKPNLDDPAAIAKFNCEKMTEMMDLMKDPIANGPKIEALGQSMDDFNKELEAHHGEKYQEIKTKVSESAKDVCPEHAGMF
jgi:hypothetical protein